MKSAIVPLALLALLALPAQAETRIGVHGGTCQQSRSDIGSWWNDHYETDIDLTTACSMIDMTRIEDGRGWRLAYVNLGTITTNSVMANRDEDQFSNPDGEDCNPATREGCLIRTVGGGLAQGISVGRVWERRLNHLTLGAELGGFVYYNHFTIQITAHPDPDLFPAEAWDYARGWLATPYAGVGIRYGMLSATVRGYHRITAHQADCGGCSGVTKGAAVQALIGISGSF